MTLDKQRKYEEDKKRHDDYKREIDGKGFREPDE